MGAEVLRGKKCAFDIADGDVVPVHLVSFDLPLFDIVHMCDGEEIRHFVFSIGPRFRRAIR